MASDIFLSLVTPSFHKSDTIESILLTLHSFLEKQNISFEIICVVEDIYFDDSYKKAQKISRQHPRSIRVIGYPAHLGKGFTVRLGLSQATGTWTGFIDAGSKINLQSLAHAIQVAQSTSSDLIIASKNHPQSKIQRDLLRKIFSFVIRCETELFFSLPVSDSLVGLKLIRASSLQKIIPSLKVNSYAFDVELLLIAHRLGYKFHEVPIGINYTTGKDSTITGPRMLFYIAKIQLDLLKILFRDKSNQLLQ